MPKFDQRAQTVTHQYNADVISVGDVSSWTSFFRQIDNMKSEIARVGISGDADPTRARQVQEALEATSLEAHKAQPSKGRITSLLKNAIAITKGVTSLESLYLELQKALDLTHRLF